METFFKKAPPLIITQTIQQRVVEAPTPTDFVETLCL